jgi:plastocyanin
MRYSLMRLLLISALALAFGSVVSAATVAQGDVPSHPSHIHAGTCAELDPNPAFPLDNVTTVSPEAALGTVETATTSIETTVDELTATPFAINVHESDENVGTFIACGDLDGPVIDGTMLVPLREQNASGYTGVAVVTEVAGGYGSASVEVTVYLVHGLSGEGAAAAADTADSNEQVAAQEVAVTIQDFVFSPDVLEVAAGTTVTWTNNDVTQHTVVSTDGFFESDILAEGNTFSFTFEDAGTFDYICSLHPNMTGQVVVTAP